MLKGNLHDQFYVSVGSNSCTERLHLHVLDILEITLDLVLLIFPLLNFPFYVNIYTVLKMLCKYEGRYITICEVSVILLDIY